MPQKRIHNSSSERQKAYRARLKRSSADEITSIGNIPRLPALSNIPGEKRWRTLVEVAQSCLLIAHTEMEAYSEERSESWHESDKAERFAERTDLIGEAVDAVDNIRGGYFE